MEFTTIKVQLGESMAWINLDRPEVRNALNAALIRDAECRADTRTN